MWIGPDVQIGAGVRLMGPLVLGDGARVGDRAQLRGSIVFPGTDVAAESILIGAIAAHSGILRACADAYNAKGPAETSPPRKVSPTVVNSRLTTGLAARLRLR